MPAADHAVPSGQNRGVWAADAGARHRSSGGGLPRDAAAAGARPQDLDRAIAALEEVADECALKYSVSIIFALLVPSE